MTLIKIGVFMSMLLITPMLVAQNATLSLWEENLEQLSAPDFITFLRHHIAHNDNQRVT